MGAKLRILERSIRPIIKEDLGLRPYKKSKLQGLKADRIVKRLDISQEQLKRHADTDVEHLIFFDEKLFSVEEKVNSHNTRIDRLAIKDMPKNIRTTRRF